MLSIERSNRAGSQYGIVVAAGDDRHVAEHRRIGGHPGADVLRLQLLDEERRRAVDGHLVVGREAAGTASLAPETDRVGDHVDPLRCGSGQCRSGRSQRGYHGHHCRGQQNCQQPSHTGDHQPVVSNRVCVATNDVMHRLPPGDRPTVSEFAITEEPAPLTEEVAPTGWPQIVPVR